MQRRETNLVTLRRAGQSVLAHLLANLGLTQPPDLAAAYVKVTEAEEWMDAQQRTAIIRELMQRSRLT
jgi:hypothetical protein